MPVDLMVAEQFRRDESFAYEYAVRNLKEILNKPVSDISFPLGIRILKINTVFELDGLRVCLSGKANGGKILTLTSHTTMVLNNEDTAYIKRLEAYQEKIKQKKSIQLSEKYDGICTTKNLEIFSILMNKASDTVLNKLPGNQAETIVKGKKLFEKASLEEQINCILQMIALYKTGRSGGCDITCIGGAKNAGVVSLSSHISNWKKYFNEVRIIDQSSAGLYESRSCNLLELL